MSQGSTTGTVSVIQVIDAIPTNGSANPVSSNGVFDALVPKADLASPALTGLPTAPTQLANDNSTKIATTAYADAKVQNSLSGSTTIAPSATSVNAALSLRKKIIVSDTISASVTGVAVETLVKTYEIPAGTLTPNGFLEIYGYASRSGTSAPHSIIFRINSVNNFATAPQLGSNSTNGNFEPHLGIKGWYVLKNNLAISPIFNSIPATNLRSSATSISVACNNTVNSVWIFVSVTPTNVGQTITVEGIEILN